MDTDSDGVGNNADTDDDGDGVADADDASHWIHKRVRIPTVMESVIMQTAMTMATGFRIVKIKILTLTE